jgi:hypothetical protein
MPAVAATAKMANTPIKERRQIQGKKKEFCCWMKCDPQGEMLKS